MREPASSTPLLSKKLEQILNSLDFIEGSHDYKAAVALFDSFPKDELFAADAEEVQGAVAALIGLRADESRAARPQRGRTLGSLIAALPRDRLNAEVRERVRDLVAERYGADAVDMHEVLGEGDRMQRPHDRLRGARPGRGLDERAPGRGRELARTWADRVRETLVGAARRQRGRMLAARWAPRCRSTTGRPSTPALAREDVGCLERLRPAASLVVGLQDEPRAGRTRVALYKRGAEGRAGRGDAAARAPRAARDRGAADPPGGRRRDCGCSSSGCSGPATRRSTSRRAASGCPTASRPSGMARPSRTRSTGSCVVGGARLAPGRGPARLPALPPADRIALHGVLPERRDRRQPAADREARCGCFELRFDPARAATRPRGGAARGDPRRPRRGRARSTTTASCATSSG